MVYGHQGKYVMAEELMRHILDLRKDILGGDSTRKDLRSRVKPSLRLESGRICVMDELVRLFYLGSR